MNESDNIEKVMEEAPGGDNFGRRPVTATTTTIPP